MSKKLRRNIYRFFRYGVWSWGWSPEWSNSPLGKEQLWAGVVRYDGIRWYCLHIWHFWLQVEVD